MMRHILFALTALTAVASAQEVSRPGDESGRLDDSEPRDSDSRMLARGVLSIPRAAVHVVLAPVRLVLWAWDRYGIAARAHELFYSESERLSVLPVFAFESGVGPRLGAQLDWRVRDHEHLRGYAGTGFQGGTMRFAGSYGVEVPDQVTARVGAEYDSRTDDRFFGVGNSDLTAPDTMPHDADAIAVSTRFKDRLTRVTAAADTVVVSDFHLAAAGAVSDRRRAVGTTGPAIDMVYTPSSLVGFDRYQMVYTELDLLWDSRGMSSEWDVRSVISNGSLLSVWAGPSWLTEGTDFWRYGVDAQHYQKLGEGPRVLSAHFHGEAISARSDEVPFTELPTLGGSALLRGYDLERFRDRIAAVGSLEYHWDLSRTLFASLFVDTGRVYAAYEDLTLKGLRTSAGFALELHAPARRVFRTSIASSLDGGVMFNFYLQPLFAVTPRVERR